MILVDGAGGAFPSINHSPWFGVTLADFVMPFFLFLVGVSVALAFKVCFYFLYILPFLFPECLIYVAVVLSSSNYLIMWVQKLAFFFENYTLCCNGFLLCTTYRFPCAALMLSVINLPCRKYQTRQLPRRKSCFELWISSSWACYCKVCFKLDANYRFLGFL